MNRRPCHLPTGHFLCMVQLSEPSTFISIPGVLGWGKYELLVVSSDHAVFLVSSLNRYQSVLLLNEISRNSINKRPLLHFYPHHLISPAFPHYIPLSPLYRLSYLHVMQFTNFTWALLFAAATTLVSAQVNGTAIHFNGDSTKVVAINTNPKTGNGVPVQLSAAIPDGQQGEGAQRWIINRGPTKVKLGSSGDVEYCLDAGTTPTNGTQMKIWQCYDNLPAQAWYYTGDNRIALENQGFCLDLPNGNSSVGQTLQIWACTTGNTNQIWTV